MAFRNKYEGIFKEDPDIVVIQECENKILEEEYISKKLYTNIIWIGNNKHKGLGIISFNNYQINIHEKFNSEFEYILPVVIKKGNVDIVLIAIWAMPHKTDRKKGYIGQIWRAINYYEDILTGNTILIGDFNSNQIWDKKRKVGNHSQVVAFLKTKKIISVYHLLNKIEHGKESNPTFYLLKNKKNPFHIDYCFLSKNLLDHVPNIKIGKYKTWISRSDHMPRDCK